MSNLQDGMFKVSIWLSLCAQSSRNQHCFGSTLIAMKLAIFEPLMAIRLYGERKEQSDGFGPVLKSATVCCVAFSPYH